MKQLIGAVEAVLRSWDAARAAEYRALEGLTDLIGTAVTVQAMVFRNKGVTSGSGVAFTRDPATGEDRLYVDFLLNAQGEDVVAGRQAAGHPEPLIAAVPGLGHELQTVRRRLEALFGDAQDFEFTVEEGRLWLLQTRTAKRTPWAALQIACDLVDEELIDPATAVQRLRDLDLVGIARVRLAADEGATPIAHGMPAGTGVTTGRAALSVESARRYAERGDPVVQHRGEMLDPPVDADVVDVDPAFGQQLFNIPLRQPIAQVPAHRHHDHLGREPVAGEHRPLRHQGHNLSTSCHHATLTAHNNDQPTQQSRQPSASAPIRSRARGRRGWRSSTPAFMALRSASVPRRCRSSDAGQPTPRRRQTRSPRAGWGDSEPAG